MQDHHSTHFLTENDRWPLQDASLDHLKLLHAVDCFPGEGGLYDGAGAANAVERYQSLWIPLMETATKDGVDMDRLVPPIDIAWVWHVHRLNPVAYEADCQRTIHQVMRLNYKLAFKFSDGTDSQSKAYEVPSVLLQPAIVDKVCLRDMVDRYTMFLKLRKAAPGVFAVPPVDVDFVWHTHMSMSAQYHKMSLQHFGDLVSHETVSPEDSARTFKRDTGFGGT
ncbi:TPA: hypothetical protein ACH3X1_008305 [Trebouxia sp. C0004]